MPRGWMSYDSVVDVSERVAVPLFTALASELDAAAERRALERDHGVCVDCGGAPPSVRPARRSSGNPCVHRRASKPLAFSMRTAWSARMQYGPRQYATIAVS